jgi:hypothetical protein
MVWSSRDDVVKPMESAKFSVYDNNLNIIDLFDTKIYQEDRLGLKTLYDNNKLIMHETTCPHNERKGLPKAEAFAHAREHKLPSCFPQLYSLMKKYLLDI